MKNIPISNKVWKRLRQHRDSLEFKHYNETIEHILAYYEIHQSLLEERTDEIMNKNKELLYKKLMKDNKIFRCYNFTCFYNMEDDRLVINELIESQLTLSHDQKRLMKCLIKIGVRYRIWNVDKSGDTKIVYDSDNNKHSSLLEERTSKKKRTNEDKMWDI